MLYYDTIEEDLSRAKEILAKGNMPASGMSAAIAAEIATRLRGGGTIYGADTFAVYKLMESFVAEIERLQAPEHAADLAIRDARHAFNLFATMPTRELHACRAAYRADLAAMTAPQGIAFCGGRLALIEAALRARGDGDVPLLARLAQALPDCDCRNPCCGHKASRHVGPNGACTEEGCPCGPGGWA